MQSARRTITSVLAAMAASACEDQPTGPREFETRRFVSRPSTQTAASLVFSQGPRNASEGNSLRSDVDVGPGSFETEQQVADDFTLQARAFVQQVSWEGSYFQTPLPASKTTVSFGVRIYTYTTAAPIFDSAVSATYTQAGVSDFGSPIYRFSANIGNIVLEPNVRYWISIVDRDVETAVDFRWWNTSSVASGTMAFKNVPSDPWFVDPSTPTGDFTFDLGGAVDPIVTLFAHYPRNDNEANALRSNLVGAAGSAETGQQIADDVSLQGNAVVRRVTWEGSYFATTIDPTINRVNFVIRLFTSLGDTPAFEAPVVATYVRVGTSSFGSPIYAFSADLGLGVSLAPNVTYWLSVLDNDARTPVDFRWWMSDAESGGSYGVRSDASQPWGVQQVSSLSAFALGLDGDRPVDVTPPFIQPSVRGPLGNAGWFRGDVLVDWSFGDPESHILSAIGCFHTDVRFDTRGITLTCTATSEGGTATQSVTVRRDATAPTATAVASPPANQFGWRKQPVTVAFSGTDATSGVVACSPSATLSSDGAGQSASGICIDAAGNQSSAATAAGINIDRSFPTVTITSPVDFRTYRLNQVVRAAFSCTDALSGIDTCVGTVPNDGLLPTSKRVKNAKFTVTATDRAGTSIKYIVVYSVQ